MPKTKRLTTLLGSTLNPICRFMTKATLIVSPFDPKGNKVARCLYTHLSGGDSRLKLPEFKLEVKMDEESQNTCFEI